jgi:hypothetical protein
LRFAVQRHRMTPEKFFDYLEGKLPPPDASVSSAPSFRDPELQRQFVAARQIHRNLQRPAGESSATTRPARADDSSPPPSPCSWQ